MTAVNICSEHDCACQEVASSRRCGTCPDRIKESVACTPAMDAALSFRAGMERAAQICTEQNRWEGEQDYYAAAIRAEIAPSTTGLRTAPECNPHPDAPHGFDRNASHNAGRYVCECEGWSPDDEPSDVGEALLRKGLVALVRAHDFIRNGVEFGYIKDTSDPDWRGALRETRAAIAAITKEVEQPK